MYDTVKQYLTSYAFKILQLYLENLIEIFEATFDVKFINFG